MNLFLHNAIAHRSRIILLICSFGFIHSLLIAQMSVTTIYGDENGFYESSTGAVISSYDSNHLIGFTVDGITFSTGVNDALLTTNGITFTP